MIAPGSPPGRRRLVVVSGAITLTLLIAITTGLAVGPTPISTPRILGALLSYLGVGHSTLTPLQSTIVWQLRAPRLVLGLVAGAMLATAGASYQGVFRNPLADPYLLGVAAGAGLGATFAIVRTGVGNAIPVWTPWLAFSGALLAVLATWTIGGRSLRSTPATLLLAGVAVSALLTSAQTYLQQQASAQSIARVYIWLLGSLAGASWHSVGVIVPYVVVSLVVCLFAARALDVLSVGEEEAQSLGIRVRQVRWAVIAAASLGTSAVVSAAGLIGFVGIIVPHTIRLMVGVSYRRIVPLSLVLGAAFLVLADTVARTVMAPSELPLGVVTALIGAPIFVVILSWRRST